MSRPYRGLELYFVMNINVPRLAGYHFVHFSETTGFETLGIILTGSSSAKIIAHEIGHSCGFSDIYVSGSGAGGTPVLTATDPVQRSRMKHDWGCEKPQVKFTQYETQDEVIGKLLMCGEGGDSFSHDLPYGDIYGVWKPTDGTNIYITISPVPVGAAVRPVLPAVHH